jgi:hypothetical protein
MNFFRVSGLLWLGLLAIRVYFDKRAATKRLQKDVIINGVLEPIDSKWQSVGGVPQSLQIKTKQIEHHRAR